MFSGKLRLASPVLLTALLATTTSPSLAGSLYIAPSVIFQSISSDKDNYDYTFGGITVRGAVGYGLQFNEWFYVAGEFFADPALIKVYDNTEPNVSNLKTGYDYGLSLVPGIILDDEVMLYGRIGFMTSNFENFSTTTGFQVGVGLDWRLTQCLSARFEFNYTKYTQVSSVVGSPTADGYLVGLLYRFWEN